MQANFSSAIEDRNSKKIKIEFAEINESGEITIEAIKNKTIIEQRTNNMIKNPGSAGK